MEKATFCGSLVLGLLSVPFGAHASKDRRSKGLPESSLCCPKDGAKVEQLYRCTVCKTEGKQGEMKKRFEFEPNRFVTFEPTELKKPSQGRVPCEIFTFVREEDLDLLQVENCLFLTHDLKFASKDALERFAVLRDAMVGEDGNLAGLGKMVYEGKERAFAVVPQGRGMLLYIMRFSAQMRDIDDLKKLEDIPEAAPPALLAIAKQIVAQMNDEFNLDDFKDLEVERINGLIEARKNNVALPSAVVEEETAGTGNAFDQLKAQLALVEAKKKAVPAKRTETSKMVLVKKTAKRKVA